MKIALYLVPIHRRPVRSMDVSAASLAVTLSNLKSCTMFMSVGDLGACRPCRGHLHPRVLVNAECRV